MAPPSVPPAPKRRSGPEPLPEAPAPPPAGRKLRPLKAAVPLRQASQSL